MSDRTLCANLSLLGCGTGQVQSLSSYFEHLAFAHNMRPKQLAALLAEHTGALTTATAVSMVTRESGTQRGTIATRQFRSAIEMATGASLEAATMESLLHAVSAKKLTNEFKRRGRYCPVCIREAGDELPYGRLLWEFDVVRACPVHNVCLHPAGECAAPQEEVLPLHQRPTMQGVCNRCGSIGHKCDPRPLTTAALEDLWVAKEVEALLAVRGDLDFNQESLKAGVHDIVNRAYGGSVVRAATAAGMSRSVVCMWFSGTRPGLPGIVQLCLNAQASVVAAFRGKYERSSTPGGVGMQLSLPKKYRRSPFTDEQIKRFLLDAADSDEPPALEALARLHNLNVDVLRRRFPEETRLLGSASAALRAKRHQQELAKYAEVFALAARSLQARGRPVNKRTLQEEAGVCTFNSRSPRKRALDQVLASARPDLMGKEQTDSRNLSRVEKLMTSLMDGRASSAQLPAK